MNLARMIGKNNGERQKVLMISNKPTSHYNVDYCKILGLVMMMERLGLMFENHR